MTPEQEIKLLKELLYCTKRSCNNCGKVNCENFQRQRIDCCGLWVSYKDYIAELENKIADIKANCDLAIEGREVKIKELEQQIEQIQDAKCTSCTDLGGLQLKITELEKENAELKERLADVNLNGNIVLRELIKAKEIIKDLLEYNRVNWLFSDIKKQAEQFIKEIEK